MFENRLETARGANYLLPPDRHEQGYESSSARGSQQIDQAATFTPPELRQSSCDDYRSTSQLGARALSGFNARCWPCRRLVYVLYTSEPEADPHDNWQLNPLPTDRSYFEVIMSYPERQALVSPFFVLGLSGPLQRPRATGRQVVLYLQEYGHLFYPPSFRRGPYSGRPKPCCQMTVGAFRLSRGGGTDMSEGVEEQTGVTLNIKLPVLPK